MNETLKQVNYVFFYKGTILSQFYHAEFIDPEFFDVKYVGPNRFISAEQYMMASKAKLFGDYETLKFIMGETNPIKIKHLGRKVKNFNQKIWEDQRTLIVYRGNYLKFTQNLNLLAELHKYEKNVQFVEASPIDRIWGIGFTQANALKNKDRWGLNLLGNILTYVRNITCDLYYTNIKNRSDFPHSEGKKEV